VILSILIIDCLTTGFNIPIFRQFFGLISLLVIPGFLIILLFNIRCGNIWEYLAMSLGISIAFIMFFGLFINQLFVLFKLANPLGVQNVVVLLTSSCLGMIIIIFHKKNTKIFFIPEDDQHLPSWVSLLFPIIFPILSAAGAIILNLGGSNIIALTTIIFITIYVLVISLNYRRISGDLFAVSIVMIGLSLLLSFSLRSLHISGWDINQEFYVYQLTKIHQVWQMDFFKDPYNSCLSLTILPTILNNYLGINDEYIFKVVYQSIFAFVPLIIFLTARKYVPPILAFFASVFFIFQPWFIQPAPALARQEIGLLFFALFTWVTFNQGFSGLKRNSLQILFGAAMVSSHYSTAYVALIIFLLTFFIVLFLRIFSKSKNHMRQTKSISGWVLLVLTTFAFYWGSIQTGTSGNISYIFQITLQNMGNVLAGDLRSEDLKLAFLNSDVNFTLQDISHYIQTQNESNPQRSSLYPNDSFQDFTPEIVLSPKISGVIQNDVFRNLLSVLFFTAKQLTKVFLIFGAPLWIIYSLRLKFSQDEFIVLNIISIAVLIIWMILPVISLYYNLFRIYLQMLVVSSISLIIGLNYMFDQIIKKQPTKIALISILIVIFFVSTNGLTTYLIGGPANMNLNNFGDDYDKFYTHQEEVASATWLSSFRDPKLSIYADDTASLRLISFGNGIIDHDKAVLPSTIAKNSYVYLDYANIWSDITQASIDGKQISYRFPISFLEKNKNLIYDNGGSKIFR
jgi:uncharacterized membrane protein